jgi:molecular chaperone Hsp33
MSDNDLLQRFLFERWPVRGHFVRLDASWRAVIEHHAYPEPVREVLGEAMAATVLLAGSLKFEGLLTLQVQGPGPLHLLVAQCTHRKAIRAVARHREAVVAPGSLAELTGGGQVTVTIENEDRSNRYQGMVPMEREHLAGCLEHYLERSEQVPSKLVVASDGTSAAGLLLQRMPAGSSASAESDPHAEAEAAEEWRRLELLASTLKPGELLGLPLTTILHRLFHEDDVRLFEGTPVFFQCTCSRERVEGILRSLGHEEVGDIIQERGAVEVRCEFCNRAYQYDAVDAATLFAATVAQASREVH